MSACAQLTFSFLKSPESQAREWCHSEWAGPPTSINEPNQDNSPQARSEAHLSSDSRAH